MTTTETSERAWRELRAAYRRRGLVLALGAGVSFGCDLPNWETLLRRLLARFSGRLDGYHNTTVVVAAIPA